MFPGGATSAADPSRPEEGVARGRVVDLRYDRLSKSWALERELS